MQRNFTSRMIRRRMKATGLCLIIVGSPPVRDVIRNLRIMPDTTPLLFSTCRSGTGSDFNEDSACSGLNGRLATRRDVSTIDGQEFA